MLSRLARVRTGLMSENQAPVDAPNAQPLQALRRQLETGSASLNLDDVTIKLGHSRLIEGLSLSVSSGETVTLMGRSGCGKSTLLAWLCGTLAPAFGAEGRVALGKDDLTAMPPEERQLGILFQEIGTASVREEVWPY